MTSRYNDCHNATPSSRPQAPDEALRVWVLIHEQPDGTWGAGGSVIPYAGLVALARQSKERESDA